MLPDRERELVATSLIGVEQLTETVHEFLDLTRIEAGELRLNLEPVRVPAVMAEALRRIEGQAVSQGISTSAGAAPDLPMVLADPLRLRAVFDNILSNALKYTPNGGRIAVEIQRTSFPGFDRGDAFSISIADTGPGIPAQFRPRIFDKFFRLEHHQTENRRERGAQVLASTCLGRSSSCTAARSRVARASTIEGPASRLLCQPASVPRSPSAMRRSATAVPHCPPSKGKPAVRI